MSRTHVPALVAVVLALTGCGVDAGATTDPTGASTPPVATSRPGASGTDASATFGADCVPAELVGTYSRTRSDADTQDTNLHGDWSLEITDCHYEIAVDGSEQGSGQLATVEESRESTRLALSGDLGCPNEFTGEALYDFSLSGATLEISEAIAGTDQCAGRASAFSGSPQWNR